MKRLRYIIIGAILCLPLSTSAWAAKEINPITKSVAHYTKGLMNDLLGQTQEAIDEYKKATEYDSKSYIIHLRLGADYARLGMFPEAIEALKLVSEFNPEDLQSRYLLALIYSSQKNFDQAAREYETILQFLSQNDPENLEVYGYLGQLYYSQGQYPKAIEQFETILKLDSKNVETMYILGSLYIEQLEREKAVEVFKQAIAYNPDHHGSLNSLAYIYAEDGRNLEEAKRMVTRALELDPDNGAYLDTLGWVYYKQDKYTEALDALKKADMFLQDPVIYDHLGDVYFKIQKHEEARYYWSQALKLLPGEVAIQQKLDNLDKKVTKSVSPNL